MNTPSEVSDLDLLSTCAKAMGFDILHTMNLRRAPHKNPALTLRVVNGTETSNGWNPLTSNSDAFDMAVAQGVIMNYCKETGLARATIGNQACVVRSADINFNPHAALRRAIVMAVYASNITHNGAAASA